MRRASGRQRGSSAQLPVAIAEVAGARLMTRLFSVHVHVHRHVQP
jgi:hypothetical protein